MIINLSPYEKNRIIKNDFGTTEMGRDLLAQDYMLKQITASLIYPEEGLGKKFWENIYKSAQTTYHTTNIAVNTYNKVWIVPDSAAVYESGNTVVVLRNHLKVMLEEDYLSLKKHDGLALNQGEASTQSNETHRIGSEIFRKIILPQLEHEVNEGKNFANLRQVYSGMILATWYKHALKESLLAKVYANKSKTKGVDQNPQNNQRIYEQYLRAFKKGVFNYIKEDLDQYTNTLIPRKYFSGGAFNNYAMGHVTTGLNQAQIEEFTPQHRPSPLLIDQANRAMQSLDFAAVSLEESSDSKIADNAASVSVTNEINRGTHDYDNRNVYIIQNILRNVPFYAKIKRTLIFAKIIQRTKGQEWITDYLSNPKPQGIAEKYFSGVSSKDVRIVEDRNELFNLFDLDAGNQLASREKGVVGYKIGEAVTVKKGVYGFRKDVNFYNFRVIIVPDRTVEVQDDRQVGAQFTFMLPEELLEIIMRLINDDPRLLALAFDGNGAWKNLHKGFIDPSLDVGVKVINLDQIGNTNRAMLTKTSKFPKALEFGRSLTTVQVKQYLNGGARIVTKGGYKLLELTKRQIFELKYTGPLVEVDSLGATNTWLISRAHYINFLEPENLSNVAILLEDNLENYLIAGMDPYKIIRGVRKGTKGLLKYALPAALAFGAFKFTAINLTSNIDYKNNLKATLYWWWQDQPQGAEFLSNYYGYLREANGQWWKSFVKERDGRSYVWWKIADKDVPQIVLNGYNLRKLTFEGEFKGQKFIYETDLEHPWSVHVTDMNGNKVGVNLFQDKDFKKHLPEAFLKELAIYVKFLIENDIGDFSERLKRHPGWEVGPVLFELIREYVDPNFKYRGWSNAAPTTDFAAVSLKESPKPEIADKAANAAVSGVRRPVLIDDYKIIRGLGVALSSVIVAALLIGGLKFSLLKKSNDLDSKNTLRATLYWWGQDQPHTVDFPLYNGYEFLSEHYGYWRKANGQWWKSVVRKKDGSNWLWRKISEAEVPKRFKIGDQNRILTFEGEFNGQQLKYQTSYELPWLIKVTNEQGIEQTIDIVKQGFNKNLPEAFIKKLAEYVKTLLVNDYGDFSLRFKGQYREEARFLLELIHEYHDPSFKYPVLSVDAPKTVGSAEQNVGGINFNSAHMNFEIKRDGRGVALPLSQQNMAQLSDIQGFTPDILSIKPAVNLAILSELNAKS